jgi:hypothetical protein
VASLSSIVLLIHPTISGVSIITTDTIWVIFDREIDEDSVDGNFFLAGPDQDTWSGPDLQLYHNRESIGDEEEILQSPDFHGIVQGELTFERINTNNYGAYSGYDYTGNGASYRTKAIFTPTRRLTENTTYWVYLSGDEDTTDSLSTGLRTRTVFDTVKGSNVGTGEAEFGGSYTGPVSVDAFYVQIYAAGDVTTSQFTWWKDSDPSILYGPFGTSEAEIDLDDGVTVSFSEGTYETGDSFYSVIKAPTLFSGNITWPFETGSGSIQTIPDTAATTILGTPLSTSTGVSTDTFDVIETYPADQATNLDVINADLNITVTFDNPIDSTTVSSSTVSVLAEPVSGISGEATCSGLLNTTLSVSNEILTIVVPSGLLFSNNVVTVTLDSSIQNTSGTSLNDDYDFYFTTTYSPLYSSVRRLRLETGAFLGSIPDDTLNFALHEASKEAEQLTWGDTIAVTDYYEFVRRQWVTCKAAETLLSNAIGMGGGLKSKRLGDLSVEYDTANAKNMMDKILNCLNKWTPGLQAGGLSIQVPVATVKGDLDPDRPAVGRLWENTGMPASNYRYVPTGKRRTINSYYNRWSGGKK